MNTTLTLSLSEGDIVVPIEKFAIEDETEHGIVISREVVVEANGEAHWNDGTAVSK